MILPIEIRQKAKAYADSNGGGLPMIQAYCEGAMAMLEYNAEKVNEAKVEGGDVRCPTFDEFWQAYNYKKAKAQTERFWKKLSTKQKIEIMESLPAYLHSLEGVDKCYQMHPATYINPNNERWKDETTRRPTQPKQLSADEREREFIRRSGIM